jgi:cobalt-zinc-cadmium efflux system outer membrane protein
MRSLSLLATAALLAGAAHAEPLTLVDALSRARTSAPGVTAKALQVDAARAAAIPAGALPDPKASVGVTDLPISGPLAGRPGLDNFSMLSLGFSQDIPNRAKRRARIQTAEAGVGVAETDELVEAQAAEVAAGQAWVALYYAERKLAALDTLEGALAQEKATAPARLASSAARPAMALEPQQLLAALADRREALRAQVLQARANLERWIGADPAVEPSGGPPNLDVDPVVWRAGLDDLPVLQAASAKVRQAEAGAAEAKADKQPDWGYQVQYDHRDPRFGDYVSARLNFTLPIFARTRQDPLIASRLAGVNAALAEREAVRREVLAGLEGALAEHAMHHAQLARARDVLIPLAKQRVDLETASYRGGSASLTDVLAARRDEVEVELTALDREAETAAHIVDLALTYGREAQ